MLKEKGPGYSKLAGGRASASSPNMAVTTGSPCSSLMCQSGFCRETERADRVCAYLCVYRLILMICLMHS